MPTPEPRSTGVSPVPPRRWTPSPRVLLGLLVAALLVAGACAFFLPRSGHEGELVWGGDQEGGALRLPRRQRPRPADRLRGRAYGPACRTPGTPRPLRAVRLGYAATPAAQPQHRLHHQRLRVDRRAPGQDAGHDPVLRLRAAA